MATRPPRTSSARECRLPMTARRLQHCREFVRRRRSPWCGTACRHSRRSTPDSRTPRLDVGRCDTSDRPGSAARPLSIQAAMGPVDHLLWPACHPGTCRAGRLLALEHHPWTFVEFSEAATFNGAAPLNEHVDEAEENVLGRADIERLSCTLAPRGARC